MPDVSFGGVLASIITGRTALEPEDLRREARARRAWAESTHERTASFVESLTEDMQPGMRVQTIVAKEPAVDGGEAYTYAFAQLISEAFENEVVTLVATKAWTMGLELFITGEGDAARLVVCLGYKSPLERVHLVGEDDV